MKKDKIIQHFINTLGVLSFSMSIASFMDKKTFYEQKAIELQKECDLLKDVIIEKDDKLKIIIDKQEKLSDFVVKFSDRVVNHINKNTNLESIPNDELIDFIEDDNLKDGLIELRKSIDDSDMSNFLNMDIFNYINQILDSLTIHQVLAIVNISAFTVILVNITSLLGVFFSEYLIQYFNLEDKYPKLGKLIKMRRTYYKYYYLLNTFIIFIMVILSLYCNILMLF